MKDNDLDKFIFDHHDDFNTDVPDDGHEKRFLSKLNTYHKTVQVKQRWKIYKIAVSFSILFILSVFILWLYQANYNKEMQFNITQSVIEFRETQNYLESQINKETELLKKIPFHEPDQIDSIFADLEIMDKNNIQLQKDLNSNPNDERLMHAILELYMIKLDAISQIIQSFSISESKEKTNTHENNI